MQQYPGGRNDREDLRGICGPRGPKLTALCLEIIILCSKISTLAMVVASELQDYFACQSECDFIWFHLPCVLGVVFLQCWIAGVTGIAVELFFLGYERDVIGNRLGSWGGCVTAALCLFYLIYLFDCDLISLVLYYYTYAISTLLILHLLQ